LKKIILAPDSFKGTISAIRVCEIMETAILGEYPNCEIIKIPLADGGEGTVDCFLTAMPGERKTAKIKGPFLEEIQAEYAFFSEKKLAVIEVASAVGLPMVVGRENPELTSSFGVGELIADACANGAKELIIGLGGSCTNDAGCGALAALGVKFYDKDEKAFVPTGKNIIEISRIDLKNLNEEVKNIKIIAMCDVRNTLYGEYGAAKVFAPQKGADGQMVKRLEAGMEHLSIVLSESLDIDVSNLIGGGAAGGMGAGFSGLLNAKLKSGIETILDIVNFGDCLTWCDLVFSGEGKIDAQSINGKVVSGVAKAAKMKGVPVCVVVGAIGDGFEPIYDMGVTAIFSICNKPGTFEEILGEAEPNLAQLMENLIKYYQVRQ